MGHLHRTQTALGSVHRRLAFRVGKAKAITTTAHKLATLETGLLIRVPLFILAKGGERIRVDTETLEFAGRAW